jgi:3-deoxy-manno-octulosonate cytidylyltransferase (CMP-KDO synthetase)
MSYENLTVAIIPARYQSTRFPGKPLFEILGKPLIQHTIENVRKCSKIDHVIIATDDERIEQVVRALGVDVEMTDSSCQTGTDRIAQVLRNRPKLQSARYLVNIQGDEPCIAQDTISGTLFAMEQKQADIGTCITRIFDEKEILSPHIVKCVKRLDGFALYFSRSPIPGAKQLTFLPTLEFFRHIGMYIFRPKSLLHFANLSKTPLEIREDLEMLRALENGMSIITQEVACASPGVDVPEDIEKVQQWITNSTTFL